jgi:nucleolin
VTARDSEEDSEEDEKPQTKTPTKVKASGVGGTKTIFVKNIAWSVDEDTISEFFHDVGEVADVRLAKDENGRSKGYGHIEFETEEEAKKAVLKSGETLEGRDLFIDLAKERGASAPNAGTPRTGSGKTAFIKGFNKNDDEDNIRSGLTEFFSECGDIATVRIPTDRETGQIKGWAILSCCHLSWSGR